MWKTEKRMHLIFACSLRSFRWRVLSSFFFVFQSAYIFCFCISFIILILSDYFTVVSHFIFVLVFFFCVAVISAVVLKFMVLFFFSLDSSWQTTISVAIAFCVPFHSLFLVRSLCVCIFLFSAYISFFLYATVHLFYEKSNSFKHSSFSFDRLIKCFIENYCQTEDRKRKSENKAAESAWNQCTYVCATSFATEIKRILFVIIWPKFLCVFFLGALFWSEFLFAFSLPACRLALFHVQNSQRYRRWYIQINWLQQLAGA